MSRLAVIIPGYNHEAYIGKAIESALSQSRKPDRLIVIDDGSSDRTVEVAREAGGDLIELHTQENAGAHVTLNRLVEMAAEDCDFIAILNSDDAYLPGRFEACLEYLEAHESEEVVVTGLELMDDDGESLPEDHSRAKWFEAVWSLGKDADVTLPEWLGKANFPATTSNIVARASYLKAHPFRDYRYAHDYFFLGQAAIEGVLGVVSDQKLLRYRVHATNTITTAPKGLILELVRLHRDLYAELGQSEMSLEQGRRFADFARASWSCVSSHHEGLFQLAIAGLLAGRELEDVLASLPEEELERFPNRGLVNTLDEGGLAMKFERLKVENDAMAERAQAAYDLAKLRAGLAASKWVALGSVLGFAKKLGKNDGGSPLEKLEVLREAVAGSGWLKWGAKLGSKGSRKLLG